MNAIAATEESPIEKRLRELEDQVALIRGAQKSEQGWESTVGMWKDDELSREVDRLGAEWRKSVTD